MGLHPTASSSEMQPEENRASRSSDELQSTKSSLYLLKYVFRNIHFFTMKYFSERWSCDRPAAIKQYLDLIHSLNRQGQKKKLFMNPNRKLTN